MTFFTALGFSDCVPGGRGDEDARAEYAHVRAVPAVPVVAPPPARPADDRVAGSCLRAPAGTHHDEAIGSRISVINKIT